MTKSDNNENGTKGNGAIIKMEKWAEMGDNVLNKGQSVGRRSHGPVVSGGIGKYYNSRMNGEWVKNLLGMKASGATLKSNDDIDPFEISEEVELETNDNNCFTEGLCKIRNARYVKDFDNEYLLGKLLGEGDNYRVKELTDRKTGCQQAVKIISKQKLQDDHILCNQFKTENQILSQLKHENIVQINELIQDEDNYYQIMDRCQHGDLYQCVREQQELGQTSISEDQAKQVAK